MGPATHLFFVAYLVFEGNVTLLKLSSFVLFCENYRIIFRKSLRIKKNMNLNNIFILKFYHSLGNYQKVYDFWINLLKFAKYKKECPTFRVFS